MHEALCTKLDNGFKGHWGGGCWDDQLKSRKLTNLANLLMGYISCYTNVMLLGPPIFIANSLYMMILLSHCWTCSK